MVFQSGPERAALVASPGHDHVAGAIHRHRVHVVVGARRARERLVPDDRAVGRGELDGLHVIIGAVPHVAGNDDVALAIHGDGDAEVDAAGRAGEGVLPKDRAVGRGVLDGLDVVLGAADPGVAGDDRVARCVERHGPGLVVAAVAGAVERLHPDHRAGRAAELDGHHVAQRRGVGVSRHDHIAGAIDSHRALVARAKAAGQGGRRVVGAVGGNRPRHGRRLRRDVERQHGNQPGCSKREAACIEVLLPVPPCVESSFRATERDRSARPMRGETTGPDQKYGSVRVW